MTAVRETVLLPVAPDAGVLAADPAALAEHERASHRLDLEPCPHCQTVGHDVHWRAYPVLDPGPCPPSGVLDDVVEACCCCLFGRGPSRTGEPLIDRLRREAHDGRDVQIEHRDRLGRWTTFEEQF